MDKDIDADSDCGSDGPPALIVSESDESSGEQGFALSDNKDNGEEGFALSESDSDNNDVEDLWALVVPHSSPHAHGHSHKRGRGRPRKWRRPFTSSRDAEPKANTDHSLIASPSSSFLRPIGPVGSLVRDVADATLKRSATKPDEDVSQFIDRMMGPVPALTAGARAESLLAGFNTTKTYHKRTAELADAGLWCSRAYIWSLLQHLTDEINTHKAQPVATMTHISYDETSMTFSVPVQDAKTPESEAMHAIASTQHTRVGLPVIQDTSASSEQRVPTRKVLTATVCKVFQCHLHLGVVMYAQGSYTVLRIPVPCPLFQADRSTALNTKRILKEWLNIPGWDSFKRLSPCNFDTSCADRAASNLSAEESLDKESELHRLALSCRIHKISRSAGLALNCQPIILSGVIAVGLTFRASQALATCRACLEEVIMESLEVLPGSKPHTPNPASKYKDKVLDLCFVKKTFASCWQRVRLDALLQSDIRQNRILVYNNSRPFNVKAYVKDLAKALLPKALPIIQRGRWLNNEDAFAGLLLLSKVHNLFPRVAQRWVHRLAGRKARHVSSEQSEEAALVLEPDSDDDKAAQEGPKKLPDGGVDWAEYNARQRGTVLILASLDPKEDFTVICTMMKPAIQFMQEAQHISSEDWQNKQFANTLEGKVGGFRIHRAALGTLCTDLLQELQVLIAGPAAWDLIPPTSQTVARASFIWAMFAQMFSSTHRLLVKEEKTYPYKLFRLLEPNPSKREAIAEEINNDRKAYRCLLDPFAVSFLGVYIGVKKLCSDECMSTLIMLAWLCCLDTATIECRWAQLRRRQRGAETWHKRFEDSSASWFIQRLRILQQASWSVPGAPAAASTTPSQGRHHKSDKTRGKIHKKQAATSRKARGLIPGGGGVRRRLLSLFLSNLNYKDEDRKLVLEAAHKWCAKQTATPDSDIFQKALLEGKAAADARRFARKHGLAHLCKQPWGVPPRATPKRMFAGGEVHQVAPVAPGPVNESSIIPHLADEYKRLRTEGKAQRECKQKAENDTHQTLCSWAQKKARTFTQDTSLPSICSPSSGFGPCPLNFPSIVGVDSSIPSYQYCKAVLEHPERIQKKGRLPMRLQEHWAQLCKKYVHEEGVGEEVVPRQKRSKCFEAGFCLHSPHGDITKEMSSIFAHTLLEEVMPPKSPGRRLWSRSRLVLCIYEAEHSPSHNTSQWLHLGDGNLSDLSFQMIPLKQIPDGHPVAIASSVLKSVALEWQGKEECINIYKFFHSNKCSPTLVWEMSCWQLSSSSHVLANLPFDPHQVHVFLVQQIPSVTIWRPLKPKLKELPMKRFRVKAQQQQTAPLMNIKPQEVTDTCLN